jgi:hypothetical protein
MNNMPGWIKGLYLFTLKSNCNINELFIIKEKNKEPVIIEKSNIQHIPAYISFCTVQEFLDSLNE